MAQKILGYRELSEEEIADINKLKAMGRSISQVIKELRTNNEHDPHWISIGKTHMQEGLSALVRAIARPEGF